MKFKADVCFYKLNDDASVTIHTEDGYLRCKSRMPLYLALNDRVNHGELRQGDLISAEFGIAYVRGQGLVLQIIAVEGQ